MVGRLAAHASVFHNTFTGLQVIKKRQMVATQRRIVLFGDEKSPQRGR